MHFSGRIVTVPFAQRVIAWQANHGRHGLPWQDTKDAYTIWLSEIMLQQTQVSTVLQYFPRFLQRFPNVLSLAAAAVDEVLGYWSGLGYYSRARNLHRAAQQVVADHQGVFPTTAAVLEQLPGVGRSTAAAIAAFSSHERGAILDGNVKRVLARHAGIDGYPGLPAVQQRLWLEAERRLPEQGIAVYTQGMMDLGSTVCLRGQPQCLLCPVSVDCVALRDGRQRSLPAPRPKKIIPETACQMLLLLHGQRVYVATRTMAAVWQGLWSLPEIASDADPVAAAAALGFQVEPPQWLVPFTHTFSHYRLTITPVLLPVTSVLAVREGGQWLDVQAIERAPLPAPVRRMLESLARQL